MTISIGLAFVAACILLALTPGPNMSLIVASTLSGGLRSGIVTLLGTGTGLAILTCAAVLGMSSVMVLMAEWFDWIRLAGALYLIVLGLLQLRSWWLQRGTGTPPPPVSNGGAYARGLLVALANPKVMLFLGAFLPQFVNPAGDAVAQLWILGGLFVATLLAVDLAYTVAVARARAALDPSRLSLLDGAAGAMLVLGGAVLASANRS